MAAAHSPQQLVVTSRRHRLIDSETPGVPREEGRFNVNGPSVVRTPEWMPDPPGAYLMYFAHHMGASIRLAAADEAWEGADLPCEPAPRGPALQRQNGLQDPYLFEDTDCQRWLFYAAAGEDSLGVTEITGTAAR